jgi:hypothetical protein
LEVKVLYRRAVESGAVLFLLIAIVIVAFIRGRGVFEMRIQW